MTTRRPARSRPRSLSAMVRSLLWGIATAALPAMSLSAQLSFVPSRGYLIDGTRMALLDDGAPALVLQNVASGASTRVGRRGSGPGEFLAPSSLVVAGDSLVGVLDAANARLQWFARQGERLVYRRGMAIDAPAMDACSVGSLVFVAVIAPPGSARIRVFGIDGAPRYSFAVRPEPVAPIERETGLQLRLACDPATRSVALLETLSARFEVFDLTGRPVWRASLPEFRPLRITVQGATATFSRPPGGAHTVMSASSLGDGRVIVSAEVLRRPAEHASSSLHWAAFLIDLRSRQVRFGGDTSCRLLDGRGSVLLGLLDDDEPVPFRVGAADSIPSACSASATSWRTLLSFR